MNSCERVIHYIDDIDHEAPRTSDALRKLGAAVGLRSASGPHPGAAAGASLLLLANVAGGGGEEGAGQSPGTSKGQAERSGLLLAPGLAKAKREGKPVSEAAKSLFALAQQPDGGAKAMATATAREARPCPTPFMRLAL